MTFLLLLLGCPPHPPPPEVPTGPVDAAAILEKAEAEPAPTPAVSTFSLSLDTADGHVSANGILLVRPPDRFRIEVRGPIGPPQLIIVSDGTGVSAWQAGKNRFHQGPDMNQQLRDATGGHAGLDALTSLLLGRLPPIGPPDKMVPDQPIYTWTGEGDSGLQVTLSPRTGRIAALDLLGPQALPVLQARVTGTDRPATLDVQFPTAKVHAALEFGEWKDAAPPDTAFQLAPPPGAEVVPIVLKPAAE